MQQINLLKANLKRKSGKIGELNKEVEKLQHENEALGNKVAEFDKDVEDFIAEQERGKESLKDRNGKLQQSVDMVKQHLTDDLVHLSYMSVAKR